MMTDLPLPLVDSIVDRALAEDLGSGDITTEACIDADAIAVAHGVARGAIVACGAPVVARVFARIDPRLDVTIDTADGSRVDRGAILWRVKGSARSVLMGERVALNFAQRMSGIATVTRSYVDAVRAGGGKNHRDNLGSAVLIKDNHIAACGGVGKAIARARERAPHTSKIECEVDTLAQLGEALAAGADIVLLDNMDTATVAEAVRITAGRAFLEASGGITPPRVTELAKAGVDAISVGAALTHSALAADIGVDFIA